MKIGPMKIGPMKIGARKSGEGRLVPSGVGVPNMHNGV